jgi:yeast amino acid transporter
MKALKHHGISRDSLPYKAPFQPWGSWFAFVATAIITFFKGFDAFIPFKADTFVTNYVGLPIFFFLWLGYKIYYKTKMIPAHEVDLVTGVRQIDEEEERYLAEEAAKGPRSTLQKLWDGL